MEVVNSVTQMPHWREPWQIACSKNATIHLFPSVVSLREAKKNCQNPQIRGKTARRIVQRVSLTHPARMRSQLLYRAASYVVHSHGWNFLRNVHNLFTCPLWLPSPAGLRVEISCETDKKKINFIFNCSEKIFLTKKRKRACPDGKNQTVRFEKIFARAESRCIRSRSTT